MGCLPAPAPAPARADPVCLDAEIAPGDALANASLARLEVDLQLHVAENVEPDGVKERDRLAVTPGRTNEDPHGASVARLLHDPLGKRESDAVSAVILRDDNRLEFGNSAMPDETRIADDPSLVFRDEDPPLEAKLAAYLGAGIESSVHSDELLEQRTACVAVDSLEVAHDHTTTLVSPRGERWSVRLARCLVGRGSHRPPPDFDGDIDYAPMWAGGARRGVTGLKP